MHTEMKNAGLRVALILLAACIAGSVAVKGAGNPRQPIDRSVIPTKHSNLAKSTKLKDQKTKAVNARHKENAGEKAGAGKQGSTDSAKEIAQLKRQLALQQKTIAQLVEAVNKLQSEITARPRPSVAASVAQPPRSMTAASVAQPSSANEVASLTPILPPLPKSQPADTNQTMAVS